MAKTKGTKAFTTSIAPVDYLDVFKGLYRALQDKMTEDIIGYSGIIIIILGGLSLVVGILTEPDFWKTSPADPEEVKNRVAQRGLIASAITTIIFGFVNGIMTVRNQVNVPTYQALIGMVLSGLLGFVLDNAIATEQGCSILNGSGDVPQMKNLGESLKFGFSSIYSPKLPRYIITIFLDVFISLIMIDAIIKYSRHWYFFRRHKSLNGIIIMAFVGFTTFLAYANATRLQWAYPPTDITYSTFEYIPTIVILLSTIMASIIFLIWKPLSGPENGIVKKSNKVILIGILFVVIVIAYYNEWLDPKPDKQIVMSVENDNVVNTIITNNNKQTSSGPGLAIYIVFVIGLVLLTMYTSPYAKKMNSRWVAGTIGTMFIILIPVLLTLV